MDPFEAMYQNVLQFTLEELIHLYPITEEFLQNYRLLDCDKSLSFPLLVKQVSEEFLEEFGMQPDDFINALCDFLLIFTKQENSSQIIHQLTILGGRSKNGTPEEIELTIHTGEVVSIVGPTGSGKSRLLEDIECLAQKDTPSGRQILLNQEVIEEETRLNWGGNLVSQISQNMNFVMDLSVLDFLKIHGHCRQILNIEETIERCYELALQLSGEGFQKSTKVTQLSGGQSRALMIADAVCMSKSPILLIDEIENAGIDRTKAIPLLMQENKIILLATHDPLLALTAKRRIVLKNGGIFKVLDTSYEEELLRNDLAEIDQQLQTVRNQLRTGERCILF